MRKLLWFCFFITLSQLSYSQQPPFWNDVQSFKKQDSASMPPKNIILFIGSSSFTNWKDVREYFPNKPILNRAFGGSTLPDLIRYKQDIVYKYQPKQVVIYCGENDFASSDTVSVNTVVTRFKQLFGLIRSKHKNVPIAYVSMKPSPSRKNLMPKYVAANNAIKSFLQGFKHTVFIDVYQSMLNADGTPKADIFVSDNLHMNAKGYAIWQKIMQPHLL
ncbi:MAG: G-D-S-L family lipolytic protein [Chitinophagaceae bacterium]|nr:G-D-S-L family lipolytic protein [Chitinophagaceae bacterium]